MALKGCALANHSLTDGQTDHTGCPRAQRHTESQGTGQPMPGQTHTARDSARTRTPLSQCDAFFWGCFSSQHSRKVHKTTQTDTKLRPLPLNAPGPPVTSLGPSTHTRAPRWHPLPRHTGRAGREVLHHLEPLRKNLNPQRLGILLPTALNMFSVPFISHSPAGGNGSGALPAAAQAITAATTTSPLGICQVK